MAYHESQWLNWRICKSFAPNLGSVGLIILVPKGRILSPGDTVRILINFKLWLPLSHLISLCLEINRQEKESPFWQGNWLCSLEVGKLPLHFGKKEYNWHPSDLLRYLLLLPGPHLIANQHVLHSENLKVIVTRSSDTLGMSSESGHQISPLD